MSNESERIKFLEETLWKVAKMLDMGLGLDDFAPDQETFDEMFECLIEPRCYLIGALGMGSWEWCQAIDGTDHWVNKWYAKTYGQAS
tara:strand:- start:54 stop:314 length:261 start_codon:yes stop_codon:yes gene_type:complete